ncbi:MAG: hypothetical protein L3J69_15075, partial [Desulfobacula sp.]|nr:hypothetical protein [Desulfobacula sp.]
MIGLLLSILCFYGYVYASSQILKIPIGQAPFFSISIIGVALFFFAVSNQLETGAFLIFVVGMVCFAGAGVHFFKQKKKIESGWFRHPAFLFALLLVFSFIITLGMTFTTIDDYVYWGIIGKYLHFYNHLPTPDTTIIARHLGYTPGTSLIHYFFYQIMNDYRPAISYFAQNIILLSALFVVIKEEKIKHNILLFI